MFFILSQGSSIQKQNMLNFFINLIVHYDSMLIEVFKNIQDHRDPQARRYPLWEILTLYVLALLSNGRSYTDVHRFGCMHIDVLRERLGFTIKKIPHFTHIRRILIGIPRETMEESFRIYSSLLTSGDPITHICFDGKALCGSTDKNGLQTHLFNAFESSNNIVLAHIVLENKESEIPALQDFLTQIEIKGKVITADAIHCQKKLLK